MQFSIYIFLNLEEDVSVYRNYFLFDQISILLCLNMSVNMLILLKIKLFFTNISISY